MEEVFLHIFVQELVDPVVLTFDVRGQLLFKEDQRVHLPEELVASRVLTLLPEVLALDFEFHVELTILGVLDQLFVSLILLLLSILLEIFNSGLDPFFLVLPGLVLGVVLDFDELPLKFIPLIGDFTFINFFNNGLGDFFHLAFGLLLVEVPVKHLLEEIALVLGFLDQALVVALVADERDVADVLADFVGHEIVHNLGVVEVVVHVWHHARRL